MKSDFDAAAVDTVKHYLDRIGAILTKLAAEPDPQGVLDRQLAPDMFDTGFNFAIATQFAARALCPPAGLDIPEIPDVYTLGTLIEQHNQIAALIAPIMAADLIHPVAHIAGEAKLTQTPADYVARFAVPNMMFHLSLAYAGLRHGGMKIGKADFDGLHVYESAP